MLFYKQLLTFFCSKSADVIDDSDEELEKMDRIEEERLRLSKTNLNDPVSPAKGVIEDADMA